jgi:hypothetical protein
VSAVAVVVDAEDCASRHWPGTLRDGMPIVARRWVNTDGRRAIVTVRGLILYTCHLASWIIMVSRLHSGTAELISGQSVTLHTSLGDLKVRQKLSKRLTTRLKSSVKPCPRRPRCVSTIHSRTY